MRVGQLWGALLGILRERAVVEGEGAEAWKRKERIVSGVRAGAGRRKLVFPLGPFAFFFGMTGVGVTVAVRRVDARGTVIPACVTTVVRRSVFPSAALSPENRVRSRGSGRNETKEWRETGTPGE